MMDTVQSLKQFFSFITILYILSIQSQLFIGAQLALDDNDLKNEIDNGSSSSNLPVISLDPYQRGPENLVIRCQGTNLQSLEAFPCDLQSVCDDVQSCVDETRAKDQDSKRCHDHGQVYVGSKCGGQCLFIKAKAETGLIECLTTTGGRVIDYVVEGMDWPNYQLMSKRTSPDIFIAVSRGWQVVPKVKDTVLYVNEVVEVRCYVMGFSSSQNFRMLLVMRDGHKVAVDPASTMLDNWGRFYEHKVGQKVTENMMAFECGSQKYQSEEWNEAQFKFVTRAQEMPRIDKTGSSGNLTLNYGAEGQQLDCKVMGGPPPKVQWFQNDQKIQNGENGYKIDTVNLVESNSDLTLSHLRLPSVTTDGVGEGYRCVATNSEGTDSFKFNIKVYFSRPRIPSKTKTGQKATYKFSKGETISMLNCTAEGVPPPLIKWRHNGQLMDDNIVSHSSRDRTDSFIKRGMAHDGLAGSYSCEASNIFGSDSMEFVVIVEPTSYGGIYGSAIAGGIVIVALAIGLLIFWRKYKLTKKQLRTLSQEEVKEFREGNPKLLESEGSKEANAVMTNAQALPFDPKYEMPTEHLNIDESSILGQGQFGMVYRGQYKSVTVAVKTTKPHADIDYFKALLSEVKIMAYVGSHPHIIEFFGAATARIEDRVVHIVVEFCSHGDLHSYLKRNRNNYCDKARSKTDVFEKTRLTSTRKSGRLSKKYFVSWCKQIASGMRYLGDKKVIHSDLAARNVLVYDEDVVKITDFGLSRQLYSYEKYTKKNKSPLPWRWMSLESLRYLDFSCQSDVWSFGVTVWEIFSLSEIPYPNQQWTVDFTKKLAEGLRLQKPDIADDDIYNIMLKCWEIAPENRSSFEALEKFFSGALQEFTFASDETTVIKMPSTAQEDMSYVELE